MNQTILSKKIAVIATESLAQKHFITAIDILMGLGYLSPAILNDWQHGRIPFLEQKLQVNLHKLTFVMKIFRQWAVEKQLLPRETAYLQKGTRTKIPLKFSKSGHDAVETHYRTHYIAPLLSQKKQERLMKKIEQAPEPIVYIILTESTCAACQEKISSGNFLMIDNNQAYCIRCSPYNELVFLPAGNIKLTRRAKYYSESWAIVLKFSRARKRYERQGLLVEEKALQQAENSVSLQEVK